MGLKEPDFSAEMIPKSLEAHDLTHDLTHWVLRS